MIKENEAYKNYSDLINKSYEDYKSGIDERLSKLDFISNQIFQFATYDSSLDELFATHGIRVWRAINSGDTFELIKDDEKYKWYIIMCHMPFFERNITWGTSIRGAFWDTYPKIYLGQQEIEFKGQEDKEWYQFSEALFAFSGI